ncbi:hypothetical protein AB0M45_21700 [Nocardia sp. NPDC051787]|uniref:hypothetical protein n=1 Tax=Nocardia sp. NPDC051787 TaxID=3155415 RepID=UPI003414915C
MIQIVAWAVIAVEALLIITALCWPERKWHGLDGESPDTLHRERERESVGKP